MATAAWEFCKDNEIELQPEGRALLRAAQSPWEYFELLLENRCYADARRVLAHALPKRRALWWGCLCAWDVYRPQPPAEVAGVLEAVVRYVLQPCEAHRRAAAARAQEVEPNSLAACLAMAAFCSAGSLAPPGVPCVAPRPFLTGRLVGVTVYLAAVLRDPTQYKAQLRRYLEIGREVASGANLWTEGATSDALEAPAGGVDPGEAMPVAPVGEMVSADREALVAVN
jgi:hypothetical protein